MFKKFFEKPKTKISEEIKKPEEYTSLENAYNDSRISFDPKKNILSPNTNPYTLEAYGIDPLGLRYERVHRKATTSAKSRRKLKSRKSKSRRKLKSRKVKSRRKLKSRRKV